MTYHLYTNGILVVSAEDEDDAVAVMQTKLSNSAMYNHNARNLDHRAWWKLDGTVMVIYSRAPRAVPEMSIVLPPSENYGSWAVKNDADIWANRFQWDIVSILGWGGSV